MRVATASTVEVVVGAVGAAVEGMDWEAEPDHRLRAPPGHRQAEPRCHEETY